MDQSQEVSIMFAMELPDAKNPKEALTRIADNFTHNRLPPHFAQGAKGFLRHVTGRTVTDTSLLLKASVPFGILKPTVANLPSMIQCGLASALMATMMSEPEAVSVDIAFSLMDGESNRGVVFEVNSGANDAKGVATTGTVLAPGMAAAFIEDTRAEGLVLSPWEQGGPALMEAAWAFLEAGRQRAH